MYRCIDRGHIFEDGELKEYKELHDEVEFKKHEKFFGCPLCGGGYEKVYNCDKCGEVLSKEDCFGGFCSDCLSSKIDCKTALRYFKKRKIIVPFMMEKIYESETPKNVSEKLSEALEINYKRMASTDLALKRTRLLDDVIGYIMVDDGDFGKKDFAEFIKEEST